MEDIKRNCSLTSLAQIQQMIAYTARENMQQNKGGNC